MISVIAMIETAAGCRDDFLSAFRDVVPLVCAEDGCIEYGPAVDAETDISLQTPLGENVVCVIEKWESLEALQAHLVAPHMGAYREKVKDMVTGTKIHILNPA